MKQTITYLISIILCSIGLFFTLLYLNLFTIGYTFLEYVYFIIRRVECNCFLIGLLLLLFTIKKGHVKWIIIMIF